MIHARQKKLEQVVFLKSLAEDFQFQDKNFLEAWPVLIKYRNVPKEMDEKEWCIVAGALTKCYQSVRFIFKIARLVKFKIINSELLYVLYYNEVTGYLSEKLRFLIQWCGTGLDLAADYDSYELARI